MPANLRATVTAIFAAAILAPPLSGQALSVDRSNTRHLHLGIHASGSAVKFDEWAGTENGAGLGLRLGYGFTDAFTLVAQVDAASMQSSDGRERFLLGHLELGGRVTFGSRRSAWRPYLDAGVTARAAQMDYLDSPMTMYGPAVSFGGGVQYYLTRRAAIDLGLKAASGRFDRVSYEGETQPFGGGSSTTSRVTAGFSFHPAG